jgi:hypothetical protein
MPTRRQFLLSCSALAAAASAAPTIALGAPFRCGGIALDQIGFLDFAGMLNTAFRVVTDSRTVELRLVGAKPTAPSRSANVNGEDAVNEEFSLLFSGPVSDPLTQNTHNFEHQRIGRFQMFVAPVGPLEPGHRYYEAVFNRPPPGTARNNLTDKSKTSRNA